MKYSVLSSVLPELTAEEVARTIAQAGYDGVEWRVNGEYHFPEATIEKDAPRIKALCDAHGIEVAGLTTYIESDDSDAIRRLAAASRVMGTLPITIFFLASAGPAVKHTLTMKRTAVIMIINCNRWFFIILPPCLMLRF